ncbi:helix-turn-helix domain-containing protein [Beggiatoa leptomitoformis]|uniref:Helix-turn-helix domain-containing protein n=1 Tax=Beggiatoa leptomitoformis TaxID=288004 RepID=A0A2N9YCY6_9GAMM|nr:helix-turn-helix transcriptional regulator [Beggiatoa leptomitoformis]ALG66418.1 helix-turn-helix domain-containing protein [Beggiatoa leptomitoformis]AUI68305.1 helix-turn-helix domain-containing protein [Beggiatoa leptomitoformis]
MNIKDARKNAGVTQKQLSELTNIRQSGISQMENGKQGVSIEQLKRIANALKIDITELVKND